jgi:hypothetical protein
MVGHCSVLDTRPTHHQPPLQESSKTLANEQAVSIRSRQRQQGKGFLNHREDDRTLHAADDTHPAQPSRLSIHRHDRHHQGQTTTAQRQCPFDAACDSEEKRFPYRLENSRTLRGCSPPTASILLYQILELKSKTRQKPPEIFLRRHHHRHLRPPPVSKSWPQRPRHPDQTTHHARSPSHRGQDPQSRPLTTHHHRALTKETEILKPVHSPLTILQVLAMATKTPTHSPPILQILNTKSKTPKHRHPPNPGLSNPSATTASSSKQQAISTAGDFDPPRCRVSEAKSIRKG